MKSEVFCFQGVWKETTGMKVLTCLLRNNIGFKKNAFSNIKLGYVLNLDII